MHALLLLAPLVLAAPKKAPSAAPAPESAPAVVEAPAPPPAPPDPLAELPAIGAEVPFSVKAPATAKLSNGVTVWVAPQPSLPLVTLVLSVPGGASLDAPGAQGLQWLTDRMLTQGAAGKDAAAFAEALEQLGASIDVSTGHTASTVTLTTRKAELARALDLVADAIVRPTFKKKAVVRERDLAVSALVADADEPVSVATRLAWARWFGAGHPYANPTDGTVAGLGTLDAKQVKARWREAWGADGATVTVAGDVTLAEVVPLLEARLGAAWKPARRAVSAAPPVPARAARSVVVVDKPGASQTMFSLVFPGAALGTPEVAPARVGTIALGGTFTSRLNALLREKRGYTYGVRASLVALPGTGILTIGTRIRTDATGPAMSDLLGELESIRKGVTPEEVVKARSAYRQDLVEAMESRAGVAGTFAGWHVAGLAPTALDADLSATGATERDAVTTAMQAYDASKALIVLVGDLAVIKPGLEAAGVTDFEVVEPL